MLLSTLKLRPQLSTGQTKATEIPIRFHLSDLIVSLTLLPRMGVQVNLRWQFNNASPRTVVHLPSDYWVG